MQSHSATTPLPTPPASEFCQIFIKIVFVCVRSVPTVFQEKTGEAKRLHWRGGACFQQKSCCSAGTDSQKKGFLSPPASSSTSLHLSQTETEYPPSFQLVGQWHSLDEAGRAKYLKKASRCPEPSLNLFRPDVCLGSVSENFHGITEKYLQNRNSAHSVDTHRYGERLGNDIQISFVCLLLRFHKQPTIAEICDYKCFKAVKSLSKHI